MCLEVKINKRAKHIETVLKPKGYNRTEEASRTKPNSTHKNSGFLLNVFSPILEIKYRTTLEKSDSGNDTQEDFKRVLTGPGWCGSVD